MTGPSGRRHLIVFFAAGGATIAGSRPLRSCGAPILAAPAVNALLLAHLDAAEQARTPQP
jgi:hypothetical protein